MIDPNKKNEYDNWAGRTAIVTGANSGLGLEVAASMAQLGAHVLLACRNIEKAEFACDYIASLGSDLSYEVLPLDLSSQESVKKAAESVLSRHARLDLLVNNAGIMGTSYAVTSDGFELQRATNFLGPFAFTGLLLPLLLSTSGSRIVNVSSIMHNVGMIRPKALEHPNKMVGAWRTYGETKLLDLAFTYELDRRLRAMNAKTEALAAHPGWSRTNLEKNVVGGKGLFGTVKGLAWKALWPIGQPAAIGALPILDAACAKDAEGGDYFGPKGAFGLYGLPKKVRSNRRSHNLKKATEIFELSEKLTGVHFNFSF